MGLAVAQKAGLWASLLDWLGLGEQSQCVKSVKAKNCMKTVNGYGGFSWQMMRIKGQPVAVISYKGRLYCRLLLCAGYDYHRNQAEIVGFLQGCVNRGRDGCV